MNQQQYWPSRSDDLAIAYAIMERYAAHHQGCLPLMAICRFGEASDTVNFALPEWIEMIVLALKLVHGEEYYEFAVDNVMIALTEEWVRKEFIVAEDAPIFHALIHYRMLKSLPKKSLH